MEYKVFSHPHNLKILNVQQGQQFPCHFCNSLINQTDSNVYACWECRFFLHEHCGNAARFIHHPSHSLHPLILIPSPTYCSGSFICNGCGKLGSSFAYSCAMCEIDLHVNCAFLPPKISHHSHYMHELEIDYRDLGNHDHHQEQRGTPVLCRICSKKIGSTAWSYCCMENGCDFRVHVDCGSTDLKLGLYQVNEVGSDDKVTQTGQNHNKPEFVNNSVQADSLAELLDLQLQMQRQMVQAQIMSSIISSARIR